MRTVQDVMHELEKNDLSEHQFAALLNELEERGMSVAFYFVDNHDKPAHWQATVTDGSDLTYFGLGISAQLAVESALGDWFAEYDCK